MVFLPFGRSFYATTIWCVLLSEPVKDSQVGAKMISISQKLFIVHELTKLNEFFLMSESNSDAIDKVQNGQKWFKKCVVNS